MIKFENYNINVNGDDILKNVSFSIKENGIYVLCGPSGSGKSTILNTIARTDYIHNGKITGNKTLNYNSTDVHYVSVDDNVFGFFTVNDNLKLFSSDQNGIDEILKELNIFELKNKKCSLLSKGERERVAIASGLIDEKPILLIDEPTANLDNEFSKVAYDVILKYGHEKITIIATHDYKMIEDKADGLIYLDNGEIVKNTIKESDNKITLSKRKSRLPIRSYFKFCFANLFTSKVGYIINTIIMTFAFILTFVSFSNLTLDTKESYINLIENKFTSNYVPITDSEYTAKNMGYKEYIDKKGLTKDDVIPILHKQFICQNDNSIYAVTTYTSYYSTPEIDEKMKTFSTRYKFSDNNYRFYPIYFSEDIVKSFKENGTELSLGDQCKYSRNTLDNYIFIYDGLLPKEASFDAIIPESFRLEQFNDHFTLTEDFHSNLNYYDDLNNYVNSLHDTTDLSIKIDSMRLGQYVKPYSSDLELIKGEAITNENEIIISDKKFYETLFSDDTRLSEFNKKYQESISINNPSYYLKGILDKVKVVGLTSSSFNVVYISPTLYNKIKAKVIDNDYNSNYFLALNKNKIRTNVDKIISGQFTIKDFDDFPISDYSGFNDTMHRHAKSIFIISLIFSLLSIGVNLIYLHNINKKNYKNYSLLMLNGKSKNQVYLLYILMTALNIIIPFVLSLCLGYPVSIGITKLFSSLGFLDRGVTDSMAYGMGFGFLSIIVLFFIFILLLLPTITSLKKKEAIKNLDHE